MRYTIWTFFATALFAIQLSATTFKVIVIDSRKGLPMKRQHVWTYVGNPRNGPPPIQAVTDENGVAVITINDSVVTVRVRDVSGSVWDHCSSSDGYSVAQIEQHGILDTNRCATKHPPNVRQPNPGELIIFVKPLRGWEGMQT
jgi:hypothetical protein